MPNKRVRIEVSTSVKGIHSYSVTTEQEIEMPIDGDLALEWAVLESSNDLVAKLDAQYPPGGVDA